MTNNNCYFVYIHIRSHSSLAFTLEMVLIHSSLTFFVTLVLGSFFSSLLLFSSDPLLIEVPHHIPFNAIKCKHQTVENHTFRKDSVVAPTVQPLVI